MQEIVWKMRYFEILSKSFKKLDLFFFWNPIMNKIMRNKRDLDSSITDDIYKEIKKFLSNILVILLVASTFSLANCELSYTPFEVFEAYAPI